MEIQGLQLVVRGIVQGVGFRPFVYGLALRLGLVGTVCNDSTGVTIELEGPTAALEAFVTALQNEAPPLARIDTIERTPLELQGFQGFQITHSVARHERNTLIAPDSATCPACLRELFDPTDRRFGYPFINCTNCGPRFTIVQDVPYDRERTTMRDFPLCPACRSEYDDPLNRRFHAQPNACPSCGPCLNWETTGACGLDPALPPLAAAAQALANGLIIALKGLGGYHLACDANNPVAVAQLRQRKHREAKPFALMVADLAAARQLCLISPAEAAMLTSPRRPILLLTQRPDVQLAPAIAPGHTTLGLMLPYTPLHSLLLAAFSQHCPTAAPPVLVMTSGNLSDEPIAYQDADAQTRLAPLVDGLLSHNRPIQMRCDDSVARYVAGGEQLLRRSRGYAPEPLRLGLRATQPILAVGGHQKNTICLLRDDQAVLSQHIGDLENLETLHSFHQAINHLQQLFAITPTAVAYDLHPAYLATQAALALDLPHKIGVQHHHAHLASVLAEHGLAGPVIGVAADGTGYGPDDAIWGGEIMVADLRSYTRVGHLAYVPLLGGAAAVRQPWRMALAYLRQTYGSQVAQLGLPMLDQIDPVQLGVVQRMAERNLNSPPTSSTGRLFDAVAALLGLHQTVRYEGQAAITLEQIALPDRPAYPFTLRPGAPFQLDFAPTIQAIVADLQAHRPVGMIAGRFHATVANAFHHACQQVRANTGLTAVALSGGVFQNYRLLSQLVSLLEADGFTVLLNRRVPPNDGGIALGQAAVAAMQLRTNERGTPHAP
ncbi:MAG: carbamoyltransferase HypF [Oscillochloridaceae bacterium umkhey_bin13]